MSVIACQEKLHPLSEQGAPHHPQFSGYLCRLLQPQHPYSMPSLPPFPSSLLPCLLSFLLSLLVWLISGSLRPSVCKELCLIPGCCGEKTGSSLALGDLTRQIIDGSAGADEESGDKSPAAVVTMPPGEPEVVGTCDLDKDIRDGILEEVDLPRRRS